MATPELHSVENTASSSALIGFMSNAKRVYDLGIALPVLLYSCGFVVLGCYSVENNLGLQAFPTIQFFSSGAAFLLIFAVVMLAVIGLRALFTNYFNWLKQARWGRRIKKALMGMTYGFMVAFLVLDKLHMEKLSLAAVFAFIFCFLFSGDVLAQSMTRYYLYFNGFFLGVGLLAWYAFVAYPATPASFGGGKPQQVHVVLDTKTLPAGLSEQLMKRETNKFGMAELEAEVYLITDSSILMKVPRTAAPATVNAQNPSKSPSITLQLRRSDVSAIFWDSRH